ncbi:MAG: methylated-DNA--[protein]-cysteine S-methyltransferase [Bdellovibrionales bacterium]|nr:methylated-DNA--[protein]-cysteine S-methyltransferase [Bdellovibrionales bacterium]
MKQWIMKAPIAPLFLVATARGLKSLLWKQQPIAMAESLDEEDEATVILNQAVTQLEEYFQGRRKKFRLPLDIAGTEFQKQVWNQLTEIPYGKTISYSELARNIGKERAVRAVGTANGRNLLSIVIPCHRVISADQTLGGYSGGLGIKAALLNFEQGYKAPTALRNTQLKFPIS